MSQYHNSNRTKNIYSEREIEETSTTEDFSVVQNEGGRDVQKKVKINQTAVRKK